MTLSEAMHTTCQACGKDAGHHRLTDSGNMFCLIPSNWRVGVVVRSLGAEEATLWMQNRARCSELKKSPISKRVAAVILEAVRGINLDIEQPTLDLRL